MKDEKYSPFYYRLFISLLYTCIDNENYKMSSRHAKFKTTTNYQINY